MDEILKGNFKVKKPVEQEKLVKKEKNLSIKERLKNKALSKIGGSMVYIEYSELIWNGDE